MCSTKLMILSLDDDILLLKHSECTPSDSAVNLNLPSLCLLTS